jgi:hypothetical protein
MPPHGAMNRREFLSQVGGCACALAISGCISTPNGRKRTAMSQESSPQQSYSNPDWDISVCGLNCARCKMVTDGKCKGCRGPLDQCWSGDCEFRPCAESKGHRYCFECAEFPCDKLQAFAADPYEHHRITVENLKKMKEIGLEKWLAQQEKPMFCPGWKF